MPKAPSRQSKPSDSSRVQSVARAVALLDAFVESSTPLSALELTERTGLDRTVVHRLLRTLESQDLVTKLGSRYAIGPRALVYGNSYVDRLGLRRVALPYLTDLHIRTIGDRPWAVTLAVPALHEVLLVERLWNRYAPLDTLIDIGVRFRFDRSAMGRSMLAFYEERKVKTILGSTRARELAPTLKRIRSRGGLEFSSSELRPGISAMAAAILRGQRPLGAVAVSGTKLGSELAADSELADVLKRVAAQIAHAAS